MKPQDVMEGCSLAVYEHVSCKKQGQGVSRAEE